MVILTSGAHILSDVNDFLKGLDSVPSPGSGAVVRGFLTPAEALTGALVLFGMGGGLTALIVYLVGLPLLLISSIGIAIGVFYTVKPLALLPHGLRLSKRAASGRGEDLNGLDIATAQFKLLFGLICTSTLLLALLIENPLL